MNTPLQNQQKAGAPVSSSLIRVDQVPKLPHLSDQEKAQTQNRVQQLWDIMNNSAETDVRRRQAHQHLTLMSQQIMQAMRAFNEQQKRTQQMRQQAPPPPQRAHTSPVPAFVQPQVQMQPQTQPQAQMQTQSQSVATNNVNTQLLPEVQQQLDAYQFCLPPAMTQGSKQADDWLKEAKTRLGSALQRMQQAKTQKANLQRLALTKQQQGGLSAVEQATFDDKVAQFNKYIAESQTFLEKFREQQTQFKTSRQQTSSVQAQVATIAEQQRQHVSNANQSSMQQSAPQIKQENMNGVQNSLPESVQTVQQQSPSLPMTPGGAAIGGFQPPSNQQPGLQYPNHAGHGSLAAPGTLNASVAPSHLHMAQGQPPLNRPGFNGQAGHGPQRSMTEPALSAIPGYALDQSEDGHVLSKKKLRELIGEVLGTESDGVTADAEDLCVEFVNDFVDDLLSQACKIAKLRGSNNLDVRDVQVVLERQYNMRIPGFSTDELRVAKRPAPALGWTQKTGAVNSNK